MKNRFKLLFTSILTFVSISICGCNSIHIHEYEWKYDTENHWQECVHCGTRIGVTAHKMNSLTDSCIVCGYKDQVAIKDEEGVMTGLTTYAKTKENVEIPSDIQYIGKEALKDSNANTVTIHKPLIGIYDGAFSGSKKLSDLTPEQVKDHISTPDETSVSWYKIGDIYYKYNEVENKEAMIDGVFYKTLKEAIEAVKEDNTTVVILKDVVKPNEPIEVSFDINLEAQAGSEISLPSNLEFNIKPGGSLRIASSVKYEDGYVRLLLEEIKERVGDTNSETLGYTSGSLIFLDKKEAPDYDKFKVEYVKSFDNEEKIYANGAPQAELLKDCFVYGTLKMDKTMTKVIGLTDYGATLNSLTVNNPIIGRNFEVHDWGFTTPTTIRIKIPIHDIRINVNLQKGSYRHLTIGKGITKTGYRSFSNWHDRSQIPAELISSLAAIVAPLTTLTIDSSLEEIGEASFYYCAGLTTVMNVEEECNLKSIGVAAFQECFNLSKVNFSKCVHLNSVRKHCFLSDTNLRDLTLPFDTGWEFSGGVGYTPEVMRNSATAAFLAVHEVAEKDWTRKDGTKFCYYDPNVKDSDGRYKNVHYVNDFQTAYNACGENFVISSCDTSNTIDQNLTITKSIHLKSCVGYEGEDYKLGNVTINPGKYLFVDPNMIKNGTKFVLKCEGKDDTYKNFPGLAIEKSENISNDDYTIEVINSNRGETFTRPHVAKFINDDKYYEACGLHNFTRNSGNYTETVNSLSNLGNMATEFVITYVFNANNVKIVDKCFETNLNVRKITFGDGVHYLSNHTIGLNNEKTLEEVALTSLFELSFCAFTICEKLAIVDFTGDWCLESIGERAFAKCPCLKEIKLPKNCKLKKMEKNVFNETPLEKFDFNGIESGWKADKHEFGPTELTPEVAAKYLTGEYKSCMWTRAV